MVGFDFRALCDADWPDLHEIVLHWSVVSMLDSWPWPADEDFTRSRCQPFTGDGFVWGICIDDRVIGTISVTDGEVGYFLAPEYQGRGIVSRALPVALQEAFATSNRDRVHAHIWADNDASRRILTKTGFKLADRSVDWSKARQTNVASERWDLSRQDFRKPLSDT